MSVAVADASPTVIAGANNRGLRDPQQTVLLYRPMRDVCPNWKRYEAPLRDLILEMEPATSQVALSLIQSGAHFLDWYFRMSGVVDFRASFTRDRIEQYYIMGMTRLNPSSRSTRRAVLRRLARAANPWAFGPRTTTGQRRQAAPGYQDDEIAEFRVLGSLQATPRRIRVLQATISLGLGAGLTSREIIHAHPDHLEVVQGILSIRVSGDRPRTVPIQSDCVPYLLELRDDQPDLSFAGFKKPDSRDPWSNMWGKLEVPRGHSLPSKRRLRNSWMIRLLDSRVDLVTLMEFAGLKYTTIFGDLLPYLKPEAASAAWARAAGQR